MAGARKQQADSSRKIKKPYKRPPQTSFLRPEIERSAAVLSGLQEQYDALSIQHTALQARLDFFQQGIAEADEELAQAMAKQAIGRPAQRWVHMAIQQESTLEALPPPTAWNCQHPMAQWSDGQVRFLLYQTCRRLGSLIRARAPADQILSVVVKCHAFGNFQLRHNAGIWTRVKSSNLMTGELDSVPSNWYDHVASLVPLESLPVFFIKSLRKAMSEYNKVVNRALRRRAELQRQLAELLPQSVNVDELCRMVESGGHDRSNRQLLLQRTTWQPQQLQQQQQQKQQLRLAGAQQVQQRVVGQSQQQCWVGQVEVEDEAQQQLPQQPALSAKELFRQQQQQLQEELRQEEQETWLQPVQQQPLLHEEQRQQRSATSEHTVLQPWPGVQGSRLQQGQWQQAQQPHVQLQLAPLERHSMLPAIQQPPAQLWLVQHEQHSLLPAAQQVAREWPELEKIFPPQQVQQQQAQQQLAVGKSIDQLLGEIEETVAVELQATALTSAVWMSSVGTQVFAAHMGAACCPFQMDGTKITQALYARIVQAGMGQT